MKKSKECFCIIGQIVYGLILITTFIGLVATVVRVWDPANSLIGLKYCAHWYPNEPTGFVSCIQAELRKEER